jgi:hypothetical protein
MTKIKLFLLAAIIAPIFTSCFYNLVEGNGEVIEETRTIPSFDKISSSGSFLVYYEYAKEPEVTIVCESNLMIYIETAVFNNELIINTPMHVNLRPFTPIEVHVKGPEVSRIYLSGSGLISTDTISSDKLELTVSGSGDIETYFTGKDLVSKISGSGDMDIFAQCENLETGISGSGKVEIDGNADYAYHNISGSGKMQAYNFEVKDAEIRISGSGELYVNVTDNLIAYISGSGNIHYIGNCNVTLNNSGSGKIINEN